MLPVVRFPHLPHQTGGQESQEQRADQRQPPPQVQGRGHQQGGQRPGEPGPPGKGRTDRGDAHPHLPQQRRQYQDRNERPGRLEGVDRREQGKPYPRQHHPGHVTAQWPLAAQQANQQEHQEQRVLQGQGAARHRDKANSLVSHK